MDLTGALELSSTAADPSPILQTALERSQQKSPESSGEEEEEAVLNYQARKRRLIESVDGIPWTDENVNRVLKTIKLTSLQGGQLYRSSHDARSVQCDRRTSDPTLIKTKDETLQIDNSTEIEFFGCFSDDAIENRMAIEELIMSRSQSFKGVMSEDDPLSSPSRMFDSDQKSVLSQRSPSLGLARAYSTHQLLEGRESIEGDLSEESGDMYFRYGSSFSHEPSQLTNSSEAIRIESSGPHRKDTANTQHSLYNMTSSPNPSLIRRSVLLPFPTHSTLELGCEDDLAALGIHKSRSSESIRSSPVIGCRRICTSDGNITISRQQKSSSVFLPRGDSRPNSGGGPFSFFGVIPQPNNSLNVPILFSDGTKPSEGLPYQPRSRHFVVIEISSGKCKRHFIQTPELLRLVHTHNQRGVVEDSLPGSLKLRDLRQICSQSLGSQRASIELRRNCILFNLVKVRCIIMHQKLILIPQGYGNDRSPRVGVLAHGGYTPLSEGSWEDDEDNLIKKLVQISELRTNGPFEFAVFESLLVEVCSYLTDELTPVVRDAEKLHDFAVGTLSSAQRLHEISDLKRKVDALADRLKGVNAAVQELLNNEEDLRRMEVTRFWNKPEEWDNPPDTSESEDAEILLECYEQEVESMLRQVNRIDEDLDDMLQMIQLHLSSIRNAFLKSELGLDVVGTVVTFIGALAGIFGMNIPNGFETSESLFWPMCQGMLTLCAVTAIVTVLAFRRVKL